MKNCKNYKIYKFKVSYPPGDGIRSFTERWKRANELTTFKELLINNFCKYNFKELCDKFINRDLYKGYRVSPFDMGVDMLQDDYGLHFDIHWDQLYIGVPITNNRMIEFFDSNIPSWVTNVKRI